MTTGTGSLDPYRSPSLPEAQSRPRWLSVVCVLAIVLGALGLANSVFGTFGMIAGPRFQQIMASRPQPGMPDDLKEAQQKMQEDMYKIQAKYIWPLGISIVLRLAVCTLLLVGGIRALNLSEPGRKLLLIACSIGLIFDLLQAIFQLIMAMENMTIMNEFMETMATRGPNTPREVEAVIKTVSSIIRVFSLLLICAMALAKIAFYIFAIRYLQKPQIISMFKTESPSAPALTSDL